MTINTGRDRAIAGAPIPPLVPADGPIHTMLAGEAPGRWGADVTGVPFLGDRAGQAVYAALLASDACDWQGPPGSLAWDGTALRAAGIAPVLRGVLLTNAYDRCPWDERVPSRTRIRSPRPSEFRDPANLARLRGEIATAHTRGLRQVIAMGKVAATVLGPLVAEVPNVVLRRVPHPSAQGLLMAAPNGGRGCTLAALGAVWQAELAASIVAGRDGVPGSA